MKLRDIHTSSKRQRVEFMYIFVIISDFSQIQVSVDN